jgi:hypothetical protein
MAGKKKSKVIHVSFRDIPFDEQLYNDIIEESKVIGQSAWMKLAAYEKIERDRNKSAKSNATKTNPQGIQSFEDLLKK